MRVVFAFVVLGVAAAACGAPQRSGTCSRVGSANDSVAMHARFVRDGLPIVIAGDSMLQCSCEARRLAGNDENRRLAGNDENRRLAGDDENRRLAGNDENRRLRGEEELLTCRTEPACRGYVVSGSLSLRLYDGEGIRQLLSRCVGAADHPTGDSLRALNVWWFYTRIWNA